MPDIVWRWGLIFELKKVKKLIELGPQKENQTC